MRANRLLITVFFSAVTLAGVFGIQSTVSAVQQNTPLTDEEVALIRSNCQSSKNTLSQLHANDALLRVNRGQVYESILTRLMDRFNDRLASNQFDNRASVSVAGSYREALTQFRRDYQTYEETLSATIDVDCQDNPEEYHEMLVEARDLRSEVYTDVLRLHRLIEDYESTVDDFILNYQRIAE